MAGVRAVVACMKRPLNLNALTLVRSYSVFPPYYVNPVFRHEEQKQLSHEQLDLLKHSPVKPALMSNTSSEFYDDLIGKFTNFVMRDGKKLLARTQVEKCLTLIKRKQIMRYHKATEAEKSTIILDPKQIFSTAVTNCTPFLELKRVYRGGIGYRVPQPLFPNRGRFLAMNWLIQTAQQHDSHNSSFAEALANELILASEFQGRVITRKQELHKQCEANRAFAHFRWLKNKHM